MSINDGKIIRTRHPWLAKLTGHPRRQVIATIVTRPARTDTHGRDVTELPGLWDEDDITDTCPHCDGGLTEAEIHRGHCPHCHENL